MTERRASSAARVMLSVAGGAAVALDAAVGRAQLVTAFARRKAERTLPGGAVVQLPFTIRDGRVSCAVLRTVDADRLLCGANQQYGELTIHRLGTAAGRPQRVAPVVIQTTLVITGGGLAVWTVTLTLAGSVDDTAQQ